MPGGVHHAALGIEQRPQGDERRPKRRVFADKLADFSQDLAMYLISLNANPNDLDSKAGFFFMVLPGQPKV